MAFEAGADYVTVLGAADDSTVKGCLAAANQYGKDVVVDMICVPDLEKRIAELEALGIRHLAVHTGVDQQAMGWTPLQDLETMTKAARHAGISAAGGIGLSGLQDYLDLHPEVVIVGSNITHSANPKEMAAAITKQLRKDTL